MKTICTKKAPAAIGPYSQGVRVKGLLFTSGQIAIDPKTNEFIGGDISTQTKQVMENLGEILNKACTSFDKVVKTTVFITNMDDFGVVNEIYGEYFKEHKPARSCVAVKNLPKDALIEIEVIAKV